MCDVQYVYMIINAWLKESLLVGRALQFAVVDAGPDISSVEIDDNASGRFTLL
jgi:hypothetical protein